MITMLHRLVDNFGFRVGLSVAIGMIAWLHPFLIPLSLIVPVLWLYENNRFKAALLVYVYFCTATYHVPKGGAVFFGDEFNTLSVVGLWLGANAVTTLPFLIFHSPVFSKRRWLLLLNFALTMLPPFGLFAVTHPIVSSGILFPSLSLIGVGAVFLLLILFSFRPYKSLVLFASSAVMVNAVAAPKADLSTFQAINSDFLQFTVDEDFEAQYHRLIFVRDTAKQRHADYLLFSESIAGRWSNPQQRYWQRNPPDGSLLFGAHQFDDAQNYDNVIIAINGDDQHVIYRQRVPIPVAMWKPYTEALSANPYWLNSGVKQLPTDEKAAFLICYEIMLPWPILIDSLNQPDVILAFANNWWAKGTNLPFIQRSILISWSRLLGVPYHLANNGV